ncbi:MAG: hypothetical protein Q9181_007491, partial [Wetmoreana brouardii]
RNEIKTRRKWVPNIHKKRLWSEAMGKYVRVKVQARVLRTIDKVGGLDEYLLGESPGRVRELGMEGWRMRWRLLGLPGVKEKIRRRRVELGVPPGGMEVWASDEELLAEGDERGESEGGKEVEIRAVEDVDGDIGTYEGAEATEEEASRFLKEYDEQRSLVKRGFMERSSSGEGPRVHGAPKSSGRISQFVVDSDDKACWCVRDVVYDDGRHGEIGGLGGVEPGGRGGGILGEKSWEPAAVKIESRPNVNVPPSPGNGKGEAINEATKLKRQRRKTRKLEPMMLKQIGLSKQLTASIMRHLSRSQERISESIVERNGIRICLGICLVVSMPTNELGSENGRCGHVMVFQFTSWVDDLGIDLEYDAFRHLSTELTLRELKALEMTDAISVEEANKIRAAIGLKPLPVPGGAGGPAFKESKDDESSSEGEPESTLESRQAQGYENWKKLQDEQDAKAKREAKNEAIKKARDAARKFTQLEGKGLGEADETTELDTKTWLLQQKKRQRKLEREKLRKLEKELAEREQVVEYTAEDLAGVKVAHELGDFDAGEQILTLKDAGIDENEEEGDELENLELRERETLQDRLNVKKKKPLYDPHETDDAGGSKILKHYDEAIEGKKRKRFTLDGQGSTAEEREAIRQSVGEKLKARPNSLDISQDLPASDYKEEHEAKIKKPKKKKAKSTRQRPIDEDDIFPTEPPGGSATNGNSMQVDPDRVESGPFKAMRDMSSFVDDDDLQANLAIQRRNALKKRKRTRPEDLARQMREEAEEASNRMDEDGQDGEGGLTIDETSEFVANLRHSPEPQKPRTRDAPKSPSNVKTESPTADDEQDIEMGSDHEERFRRATSTPIQSELTGTGLDEEANINQGVGATVALLTQRGLIKKAQDDDINALHRERQRFLAEKRKREAEAERKARLQRERDRASGKLDRMSARDREEHARWENKQRDQAESRQMAEIFSKEYRPHVELKYVDEFGRSMNQKEAFKHLSHQFHGKGSGKQKTEKHLKRIEDDKRREAMSSLDASQATGMNSAMGATAKKNRQAGVRLG